MYQQDDRHTASHRQRHPTPQQQRLLVGLFPPDGRCEPADGTCIELFAELIAARRRRDVGAGMTARRRLLGLGWSIAPTEPREGRS